MRRILVLSAFALLALASAAVANPIEVKGKLSTGNYVTAVVDVGPNGQVTGSGFLLGTNPTNGHMFQYPITINKATTGQGMLTLTGTLAGLYPVTITSAVPNGPIVFSYVVNGKTYSYTGQGVVVVK